MSAIRSNGKIVLVGLVGGVGLGVIARAWMRWISTEPEFSWSGTIFIIGSFAIFVVTQSIVYLLRQKFKGKRTTRIIQFCGVIFSIPIFMAAGGMVLPTVALASLGMWRTSLGKRTRTALVLLSLIIPVIISRDIVSDFGWSIATLGRLVLFAFIYISVVGALRPTITPLRNV